MMRTHARVVIVGGGMMGAGVAYHLAKEGWSDCVLIEKAELTSGSTWHAAGQCGHFVSSYGLAKIHDYGIKLYPELERETGQALSWHGCGSLRMAYLPEEVDWFHQTLGLARRLGVPMEIIGPAEIARIHPFYNLAGIRAAAHTPADGHIDPAGLCNAVVRGARGFGATVQIRNRVTGIRQRPGGEWEVVCEKGVIRCEHVVNAAGCYAPQVGEWVGLQVPLACMLHHYLVTEPVPAFAERATELPVVRDDYVSGYIRQEQRAGLIGIYEKKGAIAAWTEGVPWEAEHELFEADFDRIAPWLERALERVPILRDVGIRRVVHGAITHSPDGNMLLGPAPGLRNFWLACAANVGVAEGCGSGKYLAQWMVHGQAELSMREFDPRRFGAYADKEYAIIKGIEDYELRHEPHLPGRNRWAARPRKTTPLYRRLKDQGAIYVDVYGWERPRWFAPHRLSAAEDPCGYRRASNFAAVGEECRAVRERVGVMDLSSFAKHDVCGPDAEAFLERLCANRLPPRPGGIRLAHMLTEAGAIEAEVTVTRLARDRFYIISAAVGEIKDRDWMVQHRAPGEDVDIQNVSQDYGCIVLAGPRSREVLRQTTNAGLATEDFGWLRAREIDVCGVPTRALRVSYTGELGYELHVPMEGMLAVYDGLWAAGLEDGIANFGAHALNSLRMEKGYKSGSELTREITLVEAGMLHFVDFTKGFIGREATLERMQGSLGTRCVYLGVDAVDADCLGTEAVMAGGRPVGLTSSGGYGYACGRSLAFAYVEPDHASPGTELEVMLVGEARPACVLAEPVWDPKGERPRA